MPLKNLVFFHFISSLLHFVLTFIPHNHIFLQLSCFCECKSLQVLLRSPTMGRRQAFISNCAAHITTFLLRVTETELVIEAGCIGNIWDGESALIGFYLIVLIPDPWLRMVWGSFLRKFGWVLAEGGRIGVGYQTMGGNLLYVCVITIKWTEV